MRRKLLSFIFSLYLSSSVFCALEKYSRIGINVRTEEHPVFKSLRLHLFPLVQYLYEAAALANDYGDISKHELVRLVLQDAINPTMSKEHTLLSTSFYQRVHPTVAEATSKHSNRVKALKSPYNSMVITRFHEDFSQLVVRYTMAMSFIELTERAMDGFSVVIIQCDNFFRTLVGSRVSLKNFFMEYRRYQSVEVKYFIKNEEMTVSVKDGYYALLFESKFLEYIDYYKAYLSMNDLIKKFPTLFPFKGLVEPLVVPLENFLSIPNYAISRISIVESILMNFKTTFFPMNLRCFFQDGILLAPRTLKQTIPIEFLEALPNNTALYWEPIVEFEIVFQKVIDSLIPFLKNSEHVLDLEYLQETFCSCIHERENLFNTKETYSIAEYSEEYVQLNEMLLKKSFLAAHRISQANAGTSYLETLYSEFGTMYHTSFIESAFMKDEGFQLLVRTNFLEDKHPGLVCLLPRPEFALLEKFWTRLYMLVCADKNFTEDNVQFVRRSFWPYYDKIDLFRCTLGFFYLLEHFLTLLCKFIFIASGNPNDTNGVDVFIKDQVLQYMAIFRADPEVQHEYSAGVSAELTKLVNIFEKMHHEKHYKGTKALVTNLSAHPLVRWWLQINRPASLVGEYCKLFLADIAQLLVKEENSGNKQLKFIQTGLFSYLASTLEDPPKVKQIVDNANQTDIPEDPTGDVGLDTGIKLLNKFNQDCDTWDQIFKPSSSAQLPKAKVKKNREEKKKLKREDAAKRAELEKQRTISKGQKPHRIDKPRQRKVRNFQVHGEKDLSINQGLNRSINPPDYQDIKSIEKNDSIISYIDRMLDLPSSDMPPSVEYFKEKKQATEFIQNMNKYFELL